MRTLLVGAFIVGVLVATPARAQYEDKTVHFNIGGGVTPTLGEISDRFGTGGGFNFGVLFEPKSTPVLGYQVEYQYNRLAGKDRTISTSPTPGGALTDTALIESHHTMHGITFNALVKAPGDAKVKPYGIAGTGAYYRTVSLTTPGVGYTTWCDPYWYVCYPTLVPVDRIIGDRSSWDPGIDFGGGVTFALGESSVFYVEARYHYVWGPEFTDANGVSQKADSQYFPVTFGFRF
jgi:hypothetical protein